jgi:hypothetical protein
MKQGALAAMLGRARPGPNLLVAHLSHFVSLSKDDISFLETLCEKQERVQKAVNLAEEGDAPAEALPFAGAWPAAIGICQMAVGKFSHFSCQATFSVFTHS